MFCLWCFYADSKDLAKRIVSDKVLKNRAYKIALNPQYEEYQRQMANRVYKFFDKKTGGEATVISKVGTDVQKVLTQELHKPVIKILKKENCIQSLKVTCGQQ